MELHFWPAMLLSFFGASIPFGWIIAKLWGVEDLRKVGSTNIGATNVVRTAGWVPGALTFILDFLKGFIPIYFIQCTSGACAQSNVLLGVAAVLGHCYSPLLKFKGGKGVSTIFGVAIALNPWLGGVALLTYVGTLLTLRVSAIGSLFAMVVLFTGTLLFSSSNKEKLVITTLVLIIIQRHKQNWEQLLAASKQSER